MNVLPLLEVNSDLKIMVAEEEPQAASAEVRGWVDSGLTVRVLRGRKMRTWAEVFNEFAAALQFPWYFGENIEALRECLADLDWLPSQSGYVIVITDPGQVLDDADAGALSRMISVLSDAAREWGHAIELGEWWDRSAVPFHVVLILDADKNADSARRWIKAGASVTCFPEL